MKYEGLYIQLFSIHGLIRGKMPELGRDADTGGQVKYVLELARALGERDDVAKVDLVTRLIGDKAVGPEYACPIEPLSEKVQIVRIRCGGQRYIRKELLWPHLEEFIDGTIRFLKSQHKIPDLFHGHYADAGYVAMALSAAFDTPFVFTGHSMGRNKKAKLLDDGLSEVRIDRQYKINTRIHIEEEIIEKASLIITSTQQEIDKQYGLYSKGNHNRFTVIPPGIDLETFYPYYDPQLDSDLLNEEVKQTRLTLLGELHRFWARPEKPFILTLCRPDHRKNIAGLIEAYNTNKQLRAIANLAVFAGIRSDIVTMEKNEQSVLTEMLLQMDRFDLYGKLAIPKKHEFKTEVPELYRLCAESGGVFVNPAMTEPFGITLIEASACGLPIVATNDGGPVDIVASCENGILVDAGNPVEIGNAILSILVDQEAWNTFSNNGINGVRSHYSWQAHCEKAMREFGNVLPAMKVQAQKSKEIDPVRQRPSFGKRLTGLNRLMITDIDHTLVGDDTSMRHLFSLLESHSDSLAWGMSTGRSLELTISAMTEHKIPMPDIIICSVGTEIYYGPDLRTDKGWQRHISHQWRPEDIKKVLENIDFLTSQEAEGQRSHKISYYMADDYDYLFWVYYMIKEAGLRCRIIYSHGQFLDIVPLRASKGRAIDYLRYKYEFSPLNVMVAGDSGNDEDMLSSKACGLVVGNYSMELEKLKGRRNIYFSSQKYAAGIIDGLGHYSFI